MSRCIEHLGELLPGPEGILRCRVCEAAWMTAGEIEAIAGGATGFLSLETREKCGAFAKNRHCPDCEGVMAPMRIGKLDGWIEFCGACERYWVERVDFRSLQMFARRVEMREAYESLSSTGKKELALGLAKPVFHWNESHLNRFQTLLALIGIPILDSAEGNRTPWLTWFLVAFLIFAFLAGSIFPEALGPLALAWSSETGLENLLWANFIHFNMIHLLGNVWCLLVFGKAIEQRLRRFWLLNAFILFGPLCMLLQELFEPGVLIGGSSSAIFVLVGASFILQRKARVTLLFFALNYRIIPLRLPMLAFGLFTIAYQVAMAILGVSGAAEYAHFFGLLLGMGLALLAKQQPAVFLPFSRAESGVK